MPRVDLTRIKEVKMERIVQELQKIVEILLQNQNPVWLSYLSSIGPIFLTGISVFIACRQHKQNLDLQKQIANRDSINLLCQNILGVYNAYFGALRVVEQAVGNVAEVFSNPQSLCQWCNELQKAYEMLNCSYNQAKLMLDDEQMLQVLKISINKFSELYNAVNVYYHSGIPLKIIRDAWKDISSEYEIFIEDYITLAMSHQAKKKFLEKCDNIHTRHISDLMNEFKESLANKEFDEHFKKYIKIKEL